VTDTPISISATMLVPGRARGPVFALQSPLSFWGGFDAATGRIIDARHPQVGESLAGHVVVTEAGKGSSSGSSVLAEAIRLGTGPAGIVLLSRDAIVTVGAIVAAELYGKHCPVVLAEPADWQMMVAAKWIEIDAGRDRVSISIAAPADSVSLR
jgi:predicted aconitase with swiveling domain